MDLWVSSVTQVLLRVSDHTKFYRWAGYWIHRCFSGVSPSAKYLRAHFHVMGMLRFTFFYMNHPSLSTPFCSVLVSVSVFMALSIVFHSKDSPDNSPLSHSVLPVLFLPY